MSPRITAALAATALGFAAAWLFSGHNDFPFFYHPDESAKVEQVKTRDYNFHHPMLMLAATEAHLGGARGTSDPQTIVEAGRFVSATFAAVAVAAFSLLAWMRAGWLAMTATGLLLLCNQQLFELAHYMKEDPALLVGVALSFLAMAWYQLRQDWAAALCCGIACGVAISGKYIGAVMLPCAAIVIALAPRATWKQRGLHGCIVLAAGLLFFALTNLPLLTDLATFRASFGREMEFVVEGSKGMTRRVPHAVYLNVFADNTTPLIWLLLAVYYVQFWRTRRTQDAASWVTAVFPLALMIALSFSPKTNDRYFLPLTATFYYLAALGLREASSVLLPLWKPALRNYANTIGAALLLAALAFEAPRFIDVFRAFQRDDRRELAEFIRTHLPASARIAQDNRVMLPDERNRKRGRIINDLPQTVTGGDRYAAELGNLDELRAKGVSHIAVSESNYGRFFLKSLVAKGEYRGEYDRNREFYERLFREGKLLFERPRSTVIYLHPGLKLYELPPS